MPSLHSKSSFSSSHSTKNPGGKRLGMPGICEASVPEPKIVSFIYYPFVIIIEYILAKIKKRWYSEYAAYMMAHPKLPALPAIYLLSSVVFPTLLLDAKCRQHLPTASFVRISVFPVLKYREQRATDVVHNPGGFVGQAVHIPPLPSLLTRDGLPFVHHIKRVVVVGASFVLDWVDERT